LWMRTSTQRRTTMEIATRKTEDALVVKVSGAVDTEAAEILRNELGKILKLRPSRVVMDLSLVPTMGSSGIGKILIFYKSLDSSNVSFEIRGIHENLYHIFRAVKLDKLFPITMR
jgi:anti-sigma B factor antagonist